MPPAWDRLVWHPVECQVVGEYCMWRFVGILIFARAGLRFKSVVLAIVGHLVCEIMMLDGRQS